MRTGDSRKYLIDAGLLTRRQFAVSRHGDDDLAVLVDQFIDQLESARRCGQIFQFAANIERGTSSGDR